MVYLILSILSSSFIFLIFRSFITYRINTFSAIIWNYFVAGFFGLLYLQGEFSVSLIIQSNWIFYSLFLGLVFISLFLIMAKTAQEYGPSVAALANKMSLIVPYLFALIYYNEDGEILHTLGVIFALIGVFFISRGNKPKLKKYSIGLPLLLFLGSGFIDTYLQFVENQVLSTNADLKGFTAFTFLTAGLLGFVYSLAKKGINLPKKNTILAGIFLGVINYASIYFLLQAIKYRLTENAILIPINNLGIVLITSILSLLLFKEEFKRNKKLGLLISIIALIFLISS